MIFVRTSLLATAAMLAATAPAAAYVGPGAGISLIGAAIGVIVAIVVAFGVIILWPLRRLLRKRAKAAGGAGDDGGKD